MCSDGDDFALLITWTCYGTWLPGDRRGFVSNIRRTDGKYEAKHNIPGTPYSASHPATKIRAAELQAYPTMTLDRRTALVAATSLIAACDERQWHMLRAALMWNHVHVVVSNCPDNGPAARRVLKGVSQNSICQSLDASRRIWTAGGSDRYLHGDRAIEAAVHYVANQPNMLAEIVNMKIA
jgi:REP element-mobilizing transposase RayT